MSNSINPYQPPLQPFSSLPPPTSDGLPTAPCPNCSNPFGKKSSFTWWGGALGPWLLSHVTCTRCGAGFNSKTGKSNNTAIAIYFSVALVIGIIAGLAIGLSA